MQTSHQNHEAEPNDQEHIQIKNLNIAEYESGECDWLSKQFNRTPFRLYKYWLVIIFALNFIPECILICLLPLTYINIRIQMDQIIIMSLNLGFLSLLYGCGEMIYAMKSRRSRAAQRSFLKFQYYLIGSWIYLAYLIKQSVTSPLGPIYWLLRIYLVGAPVINLIGGYAVLRIFRGNRPFIIRADSEISKPSMSLSTAILEQNAVIAAELWKYEQQLNRWPYFIYNWWLKLAVVFEMSVIFSCILAKVVAQLVNLISQKEFSLKIFVSIAALILSFLNVYARFEMETAMRTRTFVKSNRASRLLKISVLASILSSLFVAIEVDPSGFQFLAPLLPSIGWPFICFALIPVISLIGALRVNKIIALRDSFASVSNFPEDSFLS